MKKEKENPFVRPPLHPNYLRRCRNHDYCRPSRYMLTFSKAPETGLLSVITGNPRISDSSNPDYPHSELTEEGRCFAAALEDWKARYPQIHIAAESIMPDHIHLCVDVRSYLPYGLGKAVSWLFGRAGRRRFESLILPSLRSGHGQEPQSASGKIAFPPFFSRGFNDKIAYDNEQWRRQIIYTLDNPRRYLIKRQNGNLFYAKWLISTGGRQYMAKGNIFLLKYPQLEVVRFSRRFAPGVFERKEEEWRQCVGNGGVLVSPFIHPKEKAVRDRAIADGGSLIRICENGFSERFAPSGEEFGLNAQGRLLLIAAVDYSTRNEDLTYAKAQSMNRIAELVASTDWVAGQCSIRKY